MLKTRKEIVENTKDEVFSGIKKDKRDELFKNLVSIKRLGNEKGIFIKEVSLLGYYIEDNKIPPKKLLGIRLK